MGRFKFAVHDEVEVLVVVQGAYKTHYVPLDTWECHCDSLASSRAGMPLRIGRKRRIYRSCNPLDVHRHKVCDQFEVTLEDLMGALTREQPSLHTTQRCLSGVIVKYGEADGKKPKFRVIKNPIFMMSSLYILPPKILAACVKCLPVSNTAEDAIEVDASQDTTPEESKAKHSITKEVVVIKDISTFTREQIEIFVRVQDLKEVVNLG
ncbi:hypothetical protein PHMEG_00021724 [Phytophthora megakarya]|uniref:Uncharacterized protein n=1 Tax=Phytophthora megakarya TaxID=4795 RepID=A0A225VKX1_9STRA|nr:hypothetical protein PHMEG_00021724 [Phytophthora megakarya]